MRTRGLEAVVFDLDGTLIDSAPDLRTALNRLLAAEGRRPLALVEVTAMIGDGAAKLVDRAFAATGVSAGAALADLTRRFLALYEPLAADETRPIEGVPTALDALRAAGLKLGICTNKPEQATRAILCALDLDARFDVVIGGDSVPGARKPDPAMVLAVLDRLGVSPAQAVMVGDSGNDVAAARAAGLPVIVRAGGYTTVAAEALGADAVIADFAALPAAIVALAAQVGAARPGSLTVSRPAH